MSDFIKTVDIIGDDALTSSIIDKNIISIVDDTLTTIGNNAFRCCRMLVEVNLPSVGNVDDYAFYDCDALTTITLPNATYLGDYAFANCDLLEEVSFPSVTNTGYTIFSGCTSLVRADLPVVTVLENNAFKDCTSLTTVNIPSATTIGGANGSFSGCTALTSLELPSVTSIEENAFRGCSVLNELILGNAKQVCSLEYNSGYTLYGTPIANGTGYVYVPGSLWVAYKTDTVWSNYADQIRPIEGIAIGGTTSATYLINTTRSVSLDYYAEDENVEFSVVSANESVATVDNITYGDGQLTFDICTLENEGEVEIVATISSSNASFAHVCLVTIYETIPEPTYSVVAVDGATYGFELNEDDYYESQNKGINSSYAICKINFNSQGVYNLYLDCINSGENNYDYGILSTVDSTLSLSYSADSGDTVFKSFKGQSSTSVQTVNYGVVSAGDHFIYVKFRKDSSSSSGNDTLQFKVRFEQ